MFFLIRTVNLVLLVDEPDVSGRTVASLCSVMSGSFQASCETEMCPGFFYLTDDNR